MMMMNLHRESTEELLQLLIRSGVSKVANVKPPSLGSRSSVGSIGLAGILLLLGGIILLLGGGDGGVLDSFGDSFDGVGSNLLSFLDGVRDSSGDRLGGGGGGVGGHDDDD